MDLPHHPAEGRVRQRHLERRKLEYTGNTGVWTPFTADAERGYVYLPIEAATGDFYGGHRHGDNLFSDSLVCLDASTGKRVWHYQTLHHDIWDYDLPAPPVLLDVTVDGKKIPAVAQVTKTGNTFVFDRYTGKPVWPIKEHPVPQTDVPGEKTARTQPVPTKPLPFEPQGLRDEDLIDFTPELKQEALKIVSDYRYGPMFIPPSVVVEGKNKGTLIRPNLSGGANWPGAAADPETGILYVSSLSTVGPIGLKQDPKISNMRYIGVYGEGFPQGSLGGPAGLPLVKPPWGRITAIDLNSGDHKWMVPNSDAPDWAKNNPALAGVNIGRTGSFDQVGLLVTKTLLFAGEGSGLWRAGGGGNKLRAHDKATGAILHEFTLPANQSGIPMTYEVDGRQFIVGSGGCEGVAGESSWRYRFPSAGFEAVGQSQHPVVRRVRAGGFNVSNVVALAGEHRAHQSVRRHHAAAFPQSGVEIEANLQARHLGRALDEPAGVGVGAARRRRPWFAAGLPADGGDQPYEPD